MSRLIAALVFVALIGVAHAQIFGPAVFVGQQGSPPAVPSTCTTALVVDGTTSFQTDSSNIFAANATGC